MTLSMALRRGRHLSTVVATAAAQPVSSISQLKSRLRNVYDPDEALKIYSSFTATMDASTSIHYALELTVRRLAKCQRFAEISNFLESHKSRPEITQEPFLSSIIRSYGDAGLLENALTTYNQMTDLGSPRSSLSFNALLAACVSCKIYDRVPLFFDEFPARFGFQPDKFSHGILIKALCEMNSPETAIEKLKEMKANGIEISVISFTTILHSLYKTGKIDEAESFWDEMVIKKGCKPDAGSYNVKLWHIHTGKPEAVLALIHEMENLCIKPDTISYNYLITCYSLNGMMDEAHKVFDEMLKTEGIHPNAATFRLMVFHLCNKGRYMTGYKVFKKSVKVRKIPDFNTLKYLVEGLVKKEHMVEAKAMVRTLTKKFPPELLKAWRKIADELGLHREEDLTEIEKVSA